MTKPTNLLNKNFVLLWQGQLVSLFGVQAYNIAMMFWIKHQTGSATLMGLVMMVSQIPGVVLGPVSGVFVDRYSRWKIIVGSDLIRGFVTISLAARQVTSQVGLCAGPDHQRDCWVGLLGG